jgi:hypothetical protein
MVASDRAAPDVLMTTSRHAVGSNHLGRGVTDRKGKERSDGGGADLI